MFRLLSALGLLISTTLSSAQIEPFTFVHFSDPHIGVQGNVDQMQQALADVDKNFPEAAFILISGDLTEFGFEEEFTSLTKVMESSSRPIHPAMGNHDVRWSNSGKENYRNALGETYKSFDYNGVRFILMDSSMLIEHYGHFDGQELKRLEEDLKAMPKGMPAVLTMHHPPLSPGHFIDNEYLFADLIGQYNVPLVCDWHGHSLQRWSRNGTTYAMGGSVSNGGAPKRSYRVFKVEPDKMTAITRIYDRNKTETEDPVPTNSLNRGKLETTRTAEGVFNISLNGEPYSGSALAMLDQNASDTLNISSGTFEIPDFNMNTGIHQLNVEVPDTGTTIINTLYFETTDDNGTTISRRFPLESGNQSHPVIADDVLYVGANDGLLRAIDLADPEGKVLWATNLNREILSSPAVTTESVVVGSMDSHVYCIDRVTGEVQWKYKTGQAVLAGPLIHDGTVYIGSGDKNMYALDLETGEKKWSFAAQKLIKATPAIANGRLFFGAWDNFFYALNAATGELTWRTPVAHKENGHYSAATSNPVLSGDNIIFCSHDYTVRCLAQETGGTVWTYKPSKTELGPSYSTAVIEGDTAYFGSINGHVVGHHVDTGKKVFDLNVRPEKKDDLFDSLPVLKDGRLYIGSVGGNVYCVDLGSESVKWSVALQPGFIFTRPALWRDRVLVGSMNDMIYEISYDNR